MAKKQEERVGSNKAALERRLNTSQILTFRWHSLSLAFIVFGVFIVFNGVFYMLMRVGGLPRYLGIFSCVRIPNDYNPEVIRKIYYVDGNVIGKLFVPAVCLLIVGVGMQLLRMHKLKKTVSDAVAKKEKEVNYP